MISLPDRIEQDGITAEAEYASVPAARRDDDWAQSARWYSVTLYHRGRQMTVPFGMGSGLREGPTAADVLNCLLSDASTYDNAIGFEDWADGLGFDADSRRAERDYREVEAQVSELRAFLGDKYDDYLYETESL
jgi:hypothetical protein